MQRRFLLISALAGSACLSASSVPLRADDGKSEGNGAVAAPPAPPEGVIFPATWLTLEAPDVRARRPFGPSAAFARYLLDRDAPPPKAGDEVVGERMQPVRWKEAVPKDGTAAIAYAEIVCDADYAMTAHLLGAAALWVNGEPFVGDVYAYGFAGVPVPLRKGANRVYVTGLHGKFDLELRPLAETERGVHPVAWDATRPDLLNGGAGVRVNTGVVVVNATDASVTADIDSADPYDGPSDEAPASRQVRLLPFGVTKVPCAQRPGTDDKGVASVSTVAAVNGAFGTVRLSLEQKGGSDARRVTRVSGIDGSVQEFSVLEPAPTLVATPTRVVLSLHGAGVDALGQARSYSHHPGTWIVAPTNRRPYGFDWQDWGRLDAYETLAASGLLGGEAPDRVYLTGHSMGGHGTWHLAANDPDRFLAIAPSAGWESFDSYGGPRPRSILDALWRGADGASDTLSLAGNLAPLPTFVLHGTKDDNVPLSQAETMLKALRDAGGKPDSHFQEGAGHWWDGEASPGADCVDWPGIFALFDRTEPQVPTSFDWTTVDPVIDATHHWVSVTQPNVYGRPIRIRAAWDAATSTATLATDNARWIQVACPAADVTKWRVVVDSASFEVKEGDAQLLFADGAWTEGGVRVRGHFKTPERSGPLKRAFDRRFALVLPTGGTEDETRETTARVRFDASVWWYRANGFADIVLDTEVLADAPRFAGRNLILYGNADTNAAWASVLGTNNERPVDVHRGSIRVGSRKWTGGNMACFFVRPRADDPDSVVGCLADTGARGCRVAMAHGLFSSGTGYPDYVAWDERALALGDGGVVAAGWFDGNWNLDGRGFLSFGGELVK
ncbi:MAG: prolyl oligopeptidase family serine peptidase [Planctomycetes bacterium]|nr:prolyl oligopeptidase family serine peptidase [Planctomycetota bacterium]